jgi:hypothetical protein
MITAAIATMATVEAARSMRVPFFRDLLVENLVCVLDREFLGRRGWSLWESGKTLGERGSFLASAR